MIKLLVIAFLVAGAGLGVNKCTVNTAAAVTVNG
jgi:hypothetical protein